MDGSQSAARAELKIQASAQSAVEGERFEADEAAFDAGRGRLDDADDFDPATPPPTLRMPLRSTLAKEAEPESLGERLFDLSYEIAGEQPVIAAQKAVQLLQEFIDCEAASILRGTLNDPALKFLAASGPVGEQLIGKTLQFGTGLVGLCFDLCVTIVVNDVREDGRHHAALDRSTGFQTRSVLCVPIVDDDNESFGVIQLLNPPEQFAEWHVECAETVARTLAGPLSGGGLQ